MSLLTDIASFNCLVNYLSIYYYGSDLLRLGRVRLFGHVECTDADDWA
jgi:hypothetical protein